MKNQISSLITPGIVVALVILVFSCSPKKMEEAKEDTDTKMNTTDAKTTVQPITEVKVFDNVDASVKSQVDNLLGKYYEMVQALTQDNADGAKAAAKTFKVDLAKFDMSKLMGEQMDFYHRQEAILSGALKNIEEGIDIEEIRTELAVVTGSMYALVKAYAANTTDVYYDFCPMAANNEGAYWLSNVKEIRNPYMGQRMPHCGNVKETIN